MVDFITDAFDIQKARADLSAPSPETLQAREKENGERKKHDMFLRGASMLTGRKYTSNISYPDYGTSSASQQKAQNQSVMTDFYRALDTISAQYEEEHGKKLTEDQMYAIGKQFNIGPQGWEDFKKYMPAIGVTDKEQRAVNDEERAVASAEMAITKDNRALAKEHRDSLNNAKVADSLISLLQEFRPLIQDAPAGTAGNWISEAVSKVHKLEGHTDLQKLEILKDLIPRLRNISKFTTEEDKQARDLEKSVIDAATAETKVEQAAEKHEIALEDQEFQRLDRKEKSLADTKALGRNISANKLYNDMIDLLADDVPYEEAYATITQQANKNISDRTVISNLESSLKGLKPADTRPASFKYLDAIEEKLTVTDSPTKNAANIAEIVDIELRDQTKTNALFHTFVAKKKMGIAIQRTLDTIKRLDPDRIDEKALRVEWLKYKEVIKDLKGDDRNEAVEAAIKQAANKLGLPHSMVKYILFPKKFE
jgi:hypothetical protein